MVACQCEFTRIGRMSVFSATIFLSVGTISSDTFGVSDTSELEFSERIFFSYDDIKKIIHKKLFLFKFYFCQA